MYNLSTFIYFWVISPKWMNRENQPLVIDEPVEFGISLVEVQDFGKITDQFRGIYGIYLKLMKKLWKITTCNWMELETTRILIDYAQKSPHILHTCSHFVFLVVFVFLAYSLSPPSQSYVGQDIHNWCGSIF